MRRSIMGKAITQISVALLIAACSTGHSAMQKSPGVALPTTGLYSSAVSAKDDTYFVVMLGGMPLILSTDFIPG
jgi:hypothetical protein